MPFAVVPCLVSIRRACRRGRIAHTQPSCLRETWPEPAPEQLASFLAKGLTNKEIAAKLNLSEFTVKNHVHRIMRQLNVESRYEAVQTIFDNGYAARM